jgi:SAM-dependent methyltransferase
MRRKYIFTFEKKRMSSASCPICQSTSVLLHFGGLKDLTFKTTARTFDLYRCDECEAQFQHPFIPESEVGQYYPSESYAPFRNVALISPDLKYHPQSMYLRMLLETHEKHDKFNLIDVGCGGGTFLKTVRHHFPNAELLGVDVSETGISNLKGAGIEGICSSLYDFRTERKFDYITASQVLEHLNRPYELLARITELAHPKSRIMIDVPNTDCYASKKYGRFWVHLDLPRHSILYNEKSLRRVMKNFRNSEIRFGGSTAAVMSSYKLSRNEDIYKLSGIQKLILKVFTPLAKMMGRQEFFNDKIVWMGQLKA